MNELAKILSPDYCWNCAEKHPSWWPEFLCKWHEKKCQKTNCQHRWTDRYYIYRDLNEVPLVCTGYVIACRYCEKEWGPSAEVVQPHQEYWKVQPRKASYVSK